MLYEIKNFSFSYDGKHNILKNVSLEIDKGEILCVLGRNGSGKTTFFNCLLGLNKNYQGSIRLHNKELKELKEKEIAKICSYVPQNANTSFAYTVTDYVVMGLAYEIGLFSKPDKSHYDKALQALKTMDLLAYKDRLYMELSGGEKQQATIARAIVGNPEVIFFDEPTAHLDYGNQVKVLRMIKNLSDKGYGVVISSHDPNHAIALGKNVALFDGKGYVEKGKMDDLLKEEKLKKIYDFDMKIRYIDEFKHYICTYENI